MEDDPLYISPSSSSEPHSQTIKLEISDNENEGHQNNEWTSKATKTLIDLYKKYRNGVGTMKVISQDMQAMGFDYTPSNCEYRWKILYRNYKKFMENQHKRGHGKRPPFPHFEFCREMHDIYGKKPNSTQQLSYSDINPNRREKENAHWRETQSRLELAQSPFNNHPSTAERDGSQNTSKPNNSKFYYFKQQKIETLREIKYEMAEYHKQKLLLMKERINQRNTFYQENLKLQKEKLEILRKIGNRLNDINERRRQFSEMIVLD